MGLVPDPPGEIVKGSILFEGEDLLKLSEKQMRRIRGGKISMIFQDPMTSLNPVTRVGDQIAEVTLLHNMIVGVTEGFKKELDVNGVGYRVAKEGNKLVMNLGFSHQVTVEEIEGITIEVPSANKIVISGTDKQKVGQFAAEVREKRPPEPYKGKGIKYTDEVIRRKEGKTGVKKK